MNSNSTTLEIIEELEALDGDFFENHIYDSREDYEKAEKIYQSKRVKMVERLESLLD